MQEDSDYCIVLAREQPVPTTIPKGLRRLLSKILHTGAVSTIIVFRDRMVVFNDGIAEWRYLYEAIAGDSERRRKERRVLRDYRSGYWRRLGGLYRTACQKP